MLPNFETAFLVAFWIEQISYLFIVNFQHTKCDLLRNKRITQTWDGIRTIKHILYFLTPVPSTKQEPDRLGVLQAVADPGFPKRGGANLQGGAPTYYLAKFFSKTAWKWKNSGPEGEGGTGPWRPPLDPPMTCFIKLYLASRHLQSLVGVCEDYISIVRGFRHAICCTRKSIKQK